MDRPLPSKMSKWGNLPHLRYVGSNEWHSACPQCGESGHDPSGGRPDRFAIHDTDSWGPARGICRKCNYFEWAESFSKQDPVIKQKMEAIAAENKRLQQEREDKVRNQLQCASFWREAHSEVSEQEKNYWIKQGVPEWAFTMHQFGTMKKLSTEFGVLPDCYRNSLTIPYFVGGWQKIQTLQFRLDVTGNDKYRFLFGTQAHWFYPWPEDEPTKIVIIFEGAKKALVAYERVSDVMYQSVKPFYMATPAKLIPNNMISQIPTQAERVIQILDPDAYVSTDKGKSAVVRNANLIGMAKSFFVRLPGKIDDMLLSGLLNKNAFRSLLIRSMPVSTLC